MEDASTPLNDSHPTIQRCIAAYRRVRAELPNDPYHHVNLENQYKAYLAFCAELPLLIDPPSVLLYIACVGRGVGIGALDSADAGRLGHLAQMAMSAWKLIHLVIPAAEQKQQQFQQKQEDAKLRRQEAAEKKQQEAQLRQQRAEQKQQQAAQKAQAPGPLPPPKGNQSHSVEPLQPSASGERQANPPLPEGNQSFEEQLRQALDSLPLFEVQKQFFHILRERGHLLPSDAELRHEPLAALHFIRLAEKIIREEVRAANPPKPEPGSAPAPNPAPTQSVQLTPAA